MQLLETSFIGLRSARHRLTSRSYAPSVTLFPMVHVGDPAFYQRVYKDALDHDIVLFEGVHSKAAICLTRSYRWLNVQRLGLVVQPKLDVTAAAGDAIPADLGGEEFDALWQGIPAWKRAIVWVAAPVYGICRGLVATRAGLARGLSQNDLTSREDSLMWNEWGQAFLDVILQARDKHLCDCVAGLVSQNKSRAVSIAIIYGAAHMPAALRCLQDIGGYAPVESEWLTIIPT